MNNNYYVYEHVRLDNNSCFYVGKGIGRRINNPSRNEHHDRVMNKYGMSVRIVKDGLTEQEAYDLERKTIENYVFNLGYGIDIDGYRDDSSFYLTNQNFGGRGNYGVQHSEEWCKNHSEAMSGENNPMYGVNLWDTYSEEKKRKMKENLSLYNKGENNPMYGVSPKDRMDEETYVIWHKKVVERGKSLIGNKNPNYGNTTLHDKVKDNPELRIQYYSRPGSQNGRAVKVSLYKDDEFIEIFDCATYCAEWIKKTLNLQSKTSSMIGAMREASKNGKTYRGYTIKYLK